MKKTQTQKEKVNRHFRDLVQNALDFLNKSIDEIDENPKHTIIDFFTAVELIIKARLLKEHWSLIIKKIEEADFEKFEKGDFQSISLNDGHLRLKKIVGEDIGKDAYEQFNKIREKRNQLVHFHKNGSDLKEIVASNILKGLYYLDFLLNEKWQPHFSSFKEEITGISQKAHKLREFLKSKFDLLQNEISEDMRNGIQYSKCKSCNFDSAKKSCLYKFIYFDCCKVCNFEGYCVKIKCPQCSASNFVSGSIGYCHKCSFQIVIQSNIDQFFPETPYDSNSLIEYNEYSYAYCNDTSCWDKTVFPINEQHSEWFCVNCNKFFNKMTNCLRCWELIAGEHDTSFGCYSCEDSLTIK